MNNLRRTFACTLICLLALSVWRFPIAAQGGSLYTIVIHNGRVLDGTGKPWMLADVAMWKLTFALSLAG